MALGIKKVVLLKEPFLKQLAPATALFAHGESGDAGFLLLEIGVVEVEDGRDKIGEGGLATKRAGEGCQKSPVGDQDAQHLAPTNLGIPVGMKADFGLHLISGKATKRMGLVAKGIGELAGKRRVPSALGQWMKSVVQHFSDVSSIEFKCKDFVHAG